MRQNGLAEHSYFPAGRGWLNRNRRETEGSEAGDSEFRLNFRELVFAVENAKSWVAQRTTHSWRLGGPSQFWVVHQSAGTMKSIRPNNDYFLYLWMPSSKRCSQTIRIYGLCLIVSMTWQTWPKPWQKRYDHFTVTTLRVTFATRIYDFSASVVSSVRFHSEIFHAKPKEFIGRQTDRTIHGKALSRPVDS